MIKGVDGKLENLKKEMTQPPPAPPSAPPEFPSLPQVVGLIGRKIVRIEWKAKMTRTLTEEETQTLSKELFNLLDKYGLDILDAKKIKEQ